MFTKTERQILQGLLDNINADFAQAKKHCIDLEKSLQKLREWKEEQDAANPITDDFELEYVKRTIERVGAGV